MFSVALKIDLKPSKGIKVDSCSSQLLFEGMISIPTRNTGIVELLNLPK